MEYKKQWCIRHKVIQKNTEFYCIHALVDRLNILSWAFSVFLFKSQQIPTSLLYCRCQWPCHSTPKQKLTQVSYVGVLNQRHFSIVFLSFSSHFWINVQFIYAIIITKNEVNSNIYRHSHLIADDNLLKQVAIQLCVSTLKICENNYYLLWFQ